MSRRVIRGRVVDELGRAIKGVDVRLFRRDPAKPDRSVAKLPVVTDASGFFEFDAPPEAGTGISLCASPRIDQAYRRSGPCEVAADGDTTIVLAPGASVRVRAIDTNGAPLDAAEWFVSLSREMLERAELDRLWRVVEQLCSEGAHAETWEARIDAAGLDAAAFLRPAVAGGTGTVAASLDRDGLVDFPGLTSGTYKVKLLRKAPGSHGHASVEPDRVVVESGDAVVVAGRLALRGPATVTVCVRVGE